MAKRVSIVTTFEEVVARTPDACAIRWESGAWTYAELNARANQLAHYLGSSGVVAETPVGVFGQRSPDVLMALLAVLKAGGAYVPLDPAYPADRIRYYVEDAAIPIVLADPREMGKFPATDAKVVELDSTLFARWPETNLLDFTGPDSLAHILYTSGSTGKPKGVLIEQVGVLRLTQDPDYITITPRDIFLQQATLNFDISTFEIWGAWLNGACVVVPPAGRGTLGDLASAIRSFGVTTTVMSAGLFHLLVEQELEALGSLRYLITGGEVVSPSHTERFLRRYPRAHLLNAYGPTENTVFSTCQTIQLEEPMPARLSIGRPIKGGDALILDSNLRPAKTGEVGEIVLTGDGLARSYLNQPELTAQSFVQVKDSAGREVRAYRSGDLGSIRTDGAIDFHGRIDDQVKINGLRIEPGEIRNLLQAHPQVSAAEVVVIESAGLKRLEIFAVARPGAPLDEKVLRDYLASKVPGNWLPSVIRLIPEMPLNANGKVDRAALRASLAEIGNKRAEEPSDELEKAIWNIWRAVLPGVSISRADRFADLGGGSLAALDMIAQVEKLMGRTIGLRPLLEGGTIIDIANAARDAAPVTSPSLMICMQEGDGRPPFFFAHGDYVVGGFYCQRIAHRLDAGQPFYTLAPQGTFGEKLPATFEEAAAAYVDLIRSVQPRGPYHLGGFCNGAVAMYEVAQQLLSAGEKVATLVLLDPPDLYFFLLRRRITKLGRMIGLPEGKSRSVYQRIAEGVEVWQYHGFMQLVKDFLARVAAWGGKRMRTSDASSADPGPNLNFHYYEVMAGYEPKAYVGDKPVTIILREGEDERTPQQVNYWSGFIADVRFEAIPGSHLELQTTVPEIAAIIEKAISS